MNNPQTVDERHGWTSASSATADSLCPGRHLAQAGIPDEPSKDAEHGSVIHEALAKQDPTGLTLEQTETYDRCLQVEAQCLEHFFGADATKATAWRENARKSDSRLWVRFMAGDKLLEHSCRPDCVWRYGDRALIVEYKTLLGDVPGAANNLQLRDQQVIIRGNWAIAGDIGTTVIQPLVSMTPAICVYSLEDSARARDEMFQRVAMSNNPGAPRVAGEAQCKFCKARPSCQQYHAFATVMVPGLLSALDVPVSQWTPEQRAVFLERRLVFKKWVTDCEVAMKLLLKGNPNAVPGWGLDLGRDISELKDTQALFERFLGLGGTPAQFVACVDVGKTLLRAEVNKVTGAKGKALEGLMEKLYAGIVEEKRSASSLIRIAEEGK